MSKILSNNWKINKDERERLRKKTEGLRSEITVSMGFELENEKDIDDEIRKKLNEVEEAEKLRKDAQAELDKIYEEWSNKKVYSNINSGRDQDQLDEIKQLIKENNEVARSVNELFEK